MLTLDQVSFRYEDTESSVLDNISLSIRKGEWVTILGRNGSGKSTLGRLFNGLLLPASGTVAINGLSTLNEESIWEIRKQVGMVFQNPDHQFVATTVQDDLAFGLENIGLEREEMHFRISKYAKLLGVTSYLSQEPHRLSGGQKQRVAIAGAMVMEPKAIVFDEVTSMLDPIGREEVLKSMQMLHERGTTIISISHRMDEANLGNRIIVLEEGHLLFDGQPVEAFTDESLLHRAGLIPPLAVELQNQLAKRGVFLNKQCVTEGELIAELWTLFSKM